MNRASRLSIKQLRILSGLVKDGNLSRLADEMGLTQQAVSANLASLRDVFGEALFLRTGRGVAPTDLARELGPEVDAILEAMERLVDRAPFDPTTAKATVRISAADYAHAVAVTPKLNKIRKDAPHLKLILSEIDVEALPEKMHSGEVDLVVSIPDHIPLAYPREHLLDEHYVCVTAKGSNLTGRRLNRKDLAREPQVVVSPGRANLIGSADDWFRQEGLVRDIILSAPHFLLLPDMIAATGAVAFFPSRLLPDERLIALDLENEISPTGFELVAAWHPRSDRSPIVQWIIQMLGNVVEPLRS